MSEREDNFDQLFGAMSPDKSKRGPIAMPSGKTAAGLGSGVPWLSIGILSALVLVVGTVYVISNRPRSASAAGAAQGEVTANADTDVKTFAMGFLQTVFTVNFNSYKAARERAEFMMTPEHQAEFRAQWYDDAFWDRLEPLKAQVTFDFKDNPGMTATVGQDGLRIWKVTVQGLLRVYSVAKQNSSTMPLNVAVYVKEQKDKNLKVAKVVTNED